jgi:hypothetical protein
MLRPMDTPTELEPTDAPPPKKRGPGRPRGSKNKSRALERENARLRKQLEAAKADPFAEQVREVRPAVDPDPASGDEPAGDPLVGEVVADEAGIPPLGEEVARAMAPAYYHAINALARVALRNAPGLDDREKARLAREVQLDPAEGSQDRQIIDPPLIQVMAKVRLTPELALLLATGTVLLGKLAVASGDAELAGLVGAPPPSSSPSPPAA